MIDQFDKQLADWVKREVSEVEISFAAPKDKDGTAKPTVNIYLLEIADDPLRHNTGNPPIQPVLRYLVTTSASDPKDAHHLLGQLFYAARKNPDFEVELEPLASQLWSAFGIAPRPGFILCIDLPAEWPLTKKKIHRVTQALVQAPTELVTLHGLVLGPNDIPLASARIELISLRKPPEKPKKPLRLQQVELTTDYTQLERATQTDRKGRFMFTNIQNAPAAKSILIRARGQEQIFVVRDTGTPEDPVVFHINFESKEK